MQKKTYESIKETKQCFEESFQVSDFILIVIPPDADDGLCIQISLLYDAAGVFL